MRATNRHSVTAAARGPARPWGRRVLPPTAGPEAGRWPDRTPLARSQNDRRVPHRRSALSLRIRQRLAQFSCIVLALFASPLGPSPAQAEALGFNPFTPADQSFTIDLPAEPVLGERKTWFPISKFVTRIYTSQVGAEEFGINSTQLPRLIGWLSSDGMILNSARDGVLEDSAATLIALERFKVHKQSAQTMVFSIPAQNGLPDLVGQARMLITQNRLFILWTETSPAVTDEELDSFFASFRIGDWTPFAKPAKPLNQPAGEDRGADRSPAPQ